MSLIPFNPLSTSKVARNVEERCWNLAELVLYILIHLKSLFFSRLHCLNSVGFVARVFSIPLHIFNQTANFLENWIANAWSFPNTTHCIEKHRASHAQKTLSTSKSNTHQLPVGNAKGTQQLKYTSTSKNARMQRHHRVNLLLAGKVIDWHDCK